MNYTRKRALLACDFCRHRKRRCDGQRPCSTCKDSNADCVYKELPYDRIEDASPTAVVDRLARIEALLEQQSQQLHYLSTNSSTPTTSSARNFDYFPSSPTFTQHAAGFANPASGSLDDQGAVSEFLIPKGHTTVATTLLSVPKVRDILGEYPRDFFYKIEENQPLPDSLKLAQDAHRGWPVLRQEMLNSLVDSYFCNVHPHHPLFSPFIFGIWQSKLLNKEQIDEPEAAICLIVYALGSLTLARATDSSDEALGLHFFKPALDIILHNYTWSFRPDLAICQALLLAGSYFSHLGRPLHCWRMACFASHKFLHYMDFRRRQFPYTECDDAELRVFWLCFLDDCNRAADLDVPRSGIEPLGDKMPLPHSLDPGDHQTTIHFIAEIAIRRLLNRIHSSLYNPENPDTVVPTDPATTWQGLSLQKLLALSSELDRQLEEWYISIPDGIRPPMGVEAMTSDRGRILRIRYYAARHIIHRPFILHTVVQQQYQQRQRSGKAPEESPGAPPDPRSTQTPPPYQLSQVVLDKCEICIDSCATYLYNAVDMLDKRTPYLWSFSQSCMACLIVLMLAESCPPLARFVPSDMGCLKDLVVTRVRRWAVEGSSLEAEVEILENLVFKDSPRAT